MRTALATAALGLIALVGCEPDAPKAVDAASVPPPVNSHAADKMKQSRTPAKPGGLAPPKKGAGVQPQ